MKQASIKNKNAPTGTLRLTQHVREGLFIVVNAVSIYLLLAFLTYHATDPGWSHAGTQLTVENAAGRVGAWLADVFYSAFGYFAYLFPFIFAYSAWVMFVRHLEEINYQSLFIRSCGFLLVLTCGSSLLDLLGAGIRTELPQSIGGILGGVFSSRLAAVCNFTGAAIILMAGLSCGFTLLTKLSWVKILDLIGQLTLCLYAYAKQAQNWLKAKLIAGINFLSASIRERVTRTSSNDEPSFENFSLETPAETPRVLTREIFQPVYETHQAINPEEIPEIEEDEIETAYGHIEEAFPKKVEIKNPLPPIKTKAEDIATVIPMQTKSSPIKKPEKPKSTQPITPGTLPPLTLLDMPERVFHNNYSTETLEMMSREVEVRLRDFGVQAQVVAVHPGPVVTRFELQLAAGVKVSKITTLAKDLARSLSVISVRVVEVIPGKPLVGLELPNENRQTVRLRETLASQPYEQARSPLSMALGKDISGHPVIVDLAKMPHLLVAGTTGAGKSVGLNAMLLSILFKATPEDVRMILIDPKMLELSIYEGIPHLLTPVVTDMKDAANALRWCVAEMDRRYRLMAALGVRNLASFNQKITDAKNSGNPIIDPLWRPQDQFEETPPELATLPYILVLVDEFADMMMVVGKKVEELIARLAQKARAAGIHLILATQRPSVDVITGLIKANIPTRIAFQVSSRIDSRTILDQQGAEQLLGHGDMLYLPPGTAVPVRVHGAFVADHEVHKVVGDWKERGGEPIYLEEITEGNKEGGVGGDPTAFDFEEESDELYDQAVQIVISSRRASISNIQRRLKIGYNRAARLVEMMEKAGLVGPMESNGTREILVPQTEEN